MKHRATGNPRGRPPKLPFDIEERVLRNLEERMDKTTLLVRPELNKLAKGLGISRSSLKRVIVGLRNSGWIELSFTKRHPTDRTFTIRYKMVKSAPAGNPTGTG